MLRPSETPLKHANDERGHRYEANTDDKLVRIKKSHGKSKVDSDRTRCGSLAAQRGHRLLKSPSYITDFHALRRRIVKMLDK